MTDVLVLTCLADYVPFVDLCLADYVPFVDLCLADYVPFVDLCLADYVPFVDFCLAYYVPFVDCVFDCCDVADFCSVDIILCPVAESQKELWL